ncbi:hypothetical protein ACFY78_20375 [Streptomyces olindensis]|uniref:hypothetical protein n=1 Tax=Streptomyces olindensis TaxID=358823 RepID=UPI00369A3B80
MSDYRYRLWLAALPQPLAEADARAYWNLKDPTPALTEALAGAAYLYVGSWQETHISERPQSGRSPALRLFDWLFLRGTIDAYQAPALDPRLRDELTALYRPHPDDLPSEHVPAQDLETFLTDHLTWHLLPEERPPTVTSPLPAEGNRR